MIRPTSQFATRGRKEKLAAMEPGTGVVLTEYSGVTVENGIMRDRVGLNYKLGGHEEPLK